MKASWLIAQVTFKELVREKTLHGLLVVFVLISLFSLVLGQLSFAEQVRLSLDFGLSVMHICLVGLAIILGCQLIHRELEKKTLFTLLVKPIHRYQYIFGKFLGLTGLLLFVMVLCATFLLVSIRYFGDFYLAEILTSALGQWFESFFLVSVVLLLGQYLKPTIAAFCGVALFLIGHWFETLQFFVKNDQGAALGILYGILSFVFPNLEKWNWKGLVIYGEYISTPEIFLAFVQASLWSLAYLSLASFFFHRRDLVT